MTSGIEPYPDYKPSGVEWLGDAPAHWEVRRLKRSIANVVSQTNKRQQDKIYIALEHVESWTGSIRESGSDADFDSQVKRFRAGDVLFGKLRPYLAKVTRPDLNGVCVGDFLPGDVETVIRQDAPQAIYRNPFLADAMVELNLIDTQGGGIKRMFDTQRRRFFPLPSYDLTEPARVSVSIHGRILDERYTRFLMERADLNLEQVMLLDMIQKGRRIGREAHRRLKADALVEGRYPNLMVVGSVAKAVGDAGRHVRERGFNQQYYLDLILALVHEHGPVGRKEIDQAVAPKLPDRLTDVQKRQKVQNLVQKLRRAGWIVNRGIRAQPAWESVEKRSGGTLH